MADEQPNNPEPDPTSDPQPEGGASEAGEQAEQALGQAQEAVDQLKSESEGGGRDAPEAEPSADGPQQGAADPTQGANVELPAFQQVLADVEAAGIDLLQDVELDVQIELGRTRMLVEDVLKLAEGGVVELDKLAGDPVDVYVNDRLVARGEVLVLNDNFCVRINEVIGADRRQAPDEIGDVAGDAGAAPAEKDAEAAATTGSDEPSAGEEAAGDQQTAPG